MKRLSSEKRRSSARRSPGKSVLRRWRITRVQQTEDSPMELAPQGSFLTLCMSIPGQLALGRRLIVVEIVEYTRSRPSHAEIACFDPDDPELGTGRGEVTCQASTMSGEIKWRDGSVLQFWGVRRGSNRKKPNTSFIPVADGSSGCNGWAVAVPFLKDTK